MAYAWALLVGLIVGPLLGCNDGVDYVELNKGADRKRDGGGASGGASGTNGKRDGGGGNSGSPTDGAIPGARDGSAIDLDASLMLPDGSVYLADGGIRLPDGTVIDLESAIMRYGPEVDVATCEISDEDTWQTEVDVGDEGAFALVPGQIGFGLAYRSIGSDTCRQGIQAMQIPAIGGFPEPHSILPECRALVDLSILVVKDGWLMAWVDNFTDMAELHTLALDADMKLVSGRTRQTLTNNDLLLERRPVLREIDGQPMVAWITDDMEAGKQSISTQLLDGKAKAIEVLPASDDQHPDGLAFSQVGPDAAVIGWVGPTGSPGVWLQKLNGKGARVGDALQLSAKVAASSSMDLAMRASGDGGGAVYSIEIDGVPQVRFRRLDATGEPLSDERTLIGAPLRAQGASLAALGGGYAVAYRALPGGEIAQPEVRLTFITKEGNVMRDPAGRLLSFPIGEASIADARTYVSVSVDGEIMVAWIDGGVSGETLLKVVRRRLDCN